MKVAIFGKKYKNNLTEFRKQARSALKDAGIKKVDETYFDTTREEDAKDTAKLMKKVEKILFRNDAIVIEATQHSDGIGIIIGLAIGYNKPILVLYSEEERKGIFSTIALASATSKRSTVKSYKGQSEISLAINQFIKDSGPLIITKFFINLPANINRYLEWWSNKKHRPKVDRIRELLNEDLENNSEWLRIDNN